MGIEMSEPKMIGGPAFPMPDYEDAYGDRVWGMSQRDWFAGQALAEIITVCRSDTRHQSESMEAMFARKSYEIADAMLAARGAK
jgi:hypothetical protein